MTSSRFEVSFFARKRTPMKGNSPISGVAVAESHRRCYFLMLTMIVS